MSLLKRFQTPLYHGAWFAFSGDRSDLRAEIGAFLRGEFEDPEGVLVVDEQGPHWKGSREIHLSYAHTEGMALLVCSQGCALGVDLEAGTREPVNPPLTIAERFFAPEETARLQALADNSPADMKNAFLDLWLKKESYGKLTRTGLKHSLPVRIADLDQVIFEEAPVAPVGYRSVVARFRSGDPRKTLPSGPADR